MRTKIMDFPGGPMVVWIHIFPWFCSYHEVRLMKKTIILNCLFLLAFMAANALAEERQIGKVKALRGLVSIIRDGRTIPAFPNKDVLLSDVIITGSDGAVGILLEDNTLLSMGPISRISMNKFDFSPATNQYAMRLGMQQGSFVYRSGLLGKLAPHAVTMDTPVGTISMLKESNFMANFPEK